MTYFSSLCESIKEDFGHSITNFLESGYDEKVVDTQSKINTNGDEMVNLEELS